MRAPLYLRTLPGAAIGALAVAFVWALGEAYEVRAVAGWMPAWGATSAAALWAAIPTSLAGAGLATLTRHPAVGGAFAASLEADAPATLARAVAAFGAGASLTFASFFLSVAFQTAFASVTVRAMASALVVVPLCLAGIGLFRLTHRVSENGLRKVPPRLLSAGPVAAAGLLALAAGVAGLGFLGASVLEALDAKRAIPAFTILAGAVSGGVALPGRRRTALLLVPLGVVVVCVAASTVLRPTPRALVVAFHQKTLGTRLVFDLADAINPRVAVRASPRPGQVVSCKPGVAPPSTKAVGKVGPKAPDIVLLMVDGLRWDRTPFGGYERKLMPGLERHGRTGAVFPAYSPSGNTRQTFRSLFTGLFPSQVYAPPGPGWGPKIPKEQPTLASLLAAGGYRTIAHLSIRELFTEERGALQGFTDKDWSAIAPNRRRGYSADHTVDRFIADLSLPGDGRPRFLWTHLNEGHSPYPHGPIPEKRFGDKRVDKYDGALRFMDLHIERLLDFLLDPSRKDRTVVVLTADHGEGFKEHGTNGGHGWTAYEEEVHVPLVVWAPGIVPKRYESRVSILDVPPTLLELAGLRTQPGHCGRSLARAMKAGKAPEPRPVYVEQLDDGIRSGFSIAHIVGDMKLVVFPKSGTQELFDLRADPREKNSLSESRKDAHAAAVTRLVEFYEEHGMDPAAYGL